MTDNCFGDFKKENATKRECSNCKVSKSCKHLTFSKIRNERMYRIQKTYFCIRCGKLILSKAHWKKYCPRCKKERQKEWLKKHLDNKNN